MSVGSLVAQLIAVLAMAALRWWAGRRENRERDEAVALVDAMERANAALRWRVGRRGRVRFRVEPGAPTVPVPRDDSSDEGAAD